MVLGQCGIGFRFHFIELGHGAIKSCWMPIAIVSSFVDTITEATIMRCRLAIVAPLVIACRLSHAYKSASSPLCAAYDRQRKQRHCNRIRIADASLGMRCEGDTTEPWYSGALWSGHKRDDDRLRFAILTDDKPARGLPLPPYRPKPIVPLVYPMGSTNAANAAETSRDQDPEAIGEAADVPIVAWIVAFPAH